PPPPNTLPPGVAPVYNPSGELQWRFGNIANAITMRILNQAPASTWSAPVSLSASPQYMFAQCTVPGCPQPPQVPSTATLSWAVVSGASNCTWTSPEDNNFTKPTVPAAPGKPSSVTVGPFPNPGPTAGGKTYSYKLTCNVPAGTVPSGQNMFSALA